MDWGQWLGPGGFAATLIGGLFLWLRDRRTSRNSVSDGPFGQLQAYCDRLSAENVVLRSAVSKLEAEKEAANDKHDEEVKELRNELEVCRRQIRELNGILMAIQNPKFQGGTM